MADQTEADKAAEAEAAEQTAEQERLLILSHADDRPAVSIAALAPRNRPVDGAETRVRRPEEVRSADEFTDPARGLEPEVPDVSAARRDGSEAGDDAAEAVEGTSTPSESVPPEVVPDRAERTRRRS